MKTSYLASWARPAVCAVAAAGLVAASVSMALPANAAQGGNDAYSTSGIGTPPEGFPTKSLKALPATAVTAQPGNTKMYLDWKAVDGASSYTVTTTKADGTKVGSVITVTASKATVSTLVNGTEYVFTVAAIVDGNDQPVGAVGATPLPVAPQSTGGPTLSLSTRTTLAVTIPALSSTGISPITGYQVRFTPADGSDPIVLSTDPANLKVTATGLQNGLTYTVDYAGINVVNGESMAGPYSAKTLTAVPTGAPAPEGFRVTTEGNHIVVLDWSDVTDATKYTVYYKLVGSTTAEKAVSTTGNPSTLKVTGLDNGREYTFQVAATTLIGTTAKVGDRSASVTGFPVSPAFPADLQVTGVGNARAYLNWAPVSGAESYYLKAEVVDANGIPSPATPAAVRIATTATATQKTIAGLTNGVEYRIRIATTKDATAGDYSTDANSALVTPAAVPGITTPVKGTVTSTAIGVTWKVPTAITGVDAPNRYKVTYTPSNGGAATVNEVTTLFDTATGLVPGVTYAIVVQAGNAAGWGMKTGVPLSVVASDKPGAVRNPVATRSGDGTAAIVKWDTPDYTGSSTIKSYTITPKQVNPVGTSPAAKTGIVNNSVEFTGLNPDADYTFTITANTDAGAGASVVTGSLAAKPTANTDASFNADSNVVTITWGKIAGNSKLSYQAQATQIPRGGSSMTTVTPATQSCDADSCVATFDKFNDNINGEVWAFRVRATDNVYSTSNWVAVPVASVEGTTAQVATPVNTCPAGMYPVGEDGAICRETMSYTYHTEMVRYSISDRWYVSGGNESYDNGSTWKSCTYDPNPPWWYDGKNWGCSEGHYEWRQEVFKDDAPAGWYDDGTQFVRDEAAPSYNTYSIKADIAGGWTTSARDKAGVAKFMANGIEYPEGRTPNLGRCPGTVDAWLTGLGGASVHKVFNLCN